MLGFFFNSYVDYLLYSAIALYNFLAKIYTEMLLLSLLTTSFYNLFFYYKFAFYFSF